jgi:hypothetical protein
MTAPLTPDVVRHIVAQKGTRFATVTFIKKDGTHRRINGLFRAVSHMVGGAGGERQAQALDRNGLIAIWSPRDGWRSFSADRVVEIK